MERPSKRLKQPDPSQEIGCLESVQVPGGGASDNDQDSGSDSESLFSQASNASSPAWDDVVWVDSKQENTPLRESLVYPKRNLSTHRRSLTLFLRTVVESKVFESRYYMSMVKILDLACLPITDDDLFEVIRRCTHLEALVIHNSDITSTSLCQIPGSLPNLHTLDISSCMRVEMAALVSRLVTGRGGLLQLKHFDFSATRVSDTDIKTLVMQYPHLETLTLEGCQNITTKTATYISMYSQSIKTLVLSDRRTSDIGVVRGAVSAQPPRALQSLDLPSSAISPLGIELILSNCTSLVTFVAKIWCNDRNDVYIFDEDDIGLLNPNPNHSKEIHLKSLTLQGVKILDAHVMPSLGRAAKLESVSFTRCGVTLETIEMLSTIQSLEESSVSRKRILVQEKLTHTP
ncbi:hypothetical protein BDR26DRAFT_899136 [Obelidium mucronatum]|nr:hypothetical protein BDR26DRAFT_899136 [Obelidium mucronatum]